jgi:hypothetical protein
MGNHTGRRFNVKRFGLLGLFVLIHLASNGCLTAALNKSNKPDTKQVEITIYTQPEGAEVIERITFPRSSPSAQLLIKEARKSDSRMGRMLTNGNNKGYSPVKVYVTLTEDSLRRWNAGECIFSIGETGYQLEVRWASGAQAKQMLEVCPQSTLRQQFTFIRPSGVPDRYLDLMFEQQIRQTRLLQRLQRQQRQNELAIAAAFHEAHQARIRANQTQQRTLNCYSYPIGSQIFTNCS